MVLVYRTVNVESAEGVKTPLQCVTFCSEPAQEWMDHRIYELAATLPRQSRKNVADKADPHLSDELRKGLNFRRGDKERMCDAHYALVQRCLAITTDLSRDRPVVVIEGKGATAAHGRGIDSDAVAATPKRRASAAFPRSVARAVVTDLPDPATMQKAFNNAVASPYPPVKSATKEEINDPYHGRTSIDNLADVPPSLRWQALMTLPRHLSVITATSENDGFLECGVAGKQTQMRSSFDPLWHIRMICSTVLGTASTCIPCGCAVPHPPTVNVIEEGNNARTSSGYWYRGCAASLETTAGSLSYTPLGIPPAESAMRCIIAGGSHALAMPDLFASYGCAPPFSDRTVFRALRFLSPTASGIMRARLDFYLERNVQKYKAYLNGLPLDQRQSVFLSVDAKWDRKIKGRYCVVTMVAVGLPAGPLLIKRIHVFRSTSSDPDAVRGGVDGVTGTSSRGLEHAGMVKLVQWCVDVGLPIEVLFPDGDSDTQELFKAAYPAALVSTCATHLSVILGELFEAWAQRPDTKGYKATVTPMGYSTASVTPSSAAASRKVLTQVYENLAAKQRGSAAVSISAASATSTASAAGGVTATSAG